MQSDRYPSYDELYERIENRVRASPAAAWAETIGHSPQGREIRAVHVTRVEIPDDDKEVVLVVCGRHGDELGTRVVGPSLIEWLLAPQTGPILERQHIILVPVANPDGCARGVFGLPRDRLSEMEQNSIVRLSRQVIPDSVIDIHSLGREKFGYHWGGLQAVVIDPEADSGEDRSILHTLTAWMIDSAGEEGYHYLRHDVGFYRQLKQRARAVCDEAFNDHFTRACYLDCHALTFGIEVNHFAYSPDQVGRSGTAIVRALLAQGQRCFPWEACPGYPNRLLGGDFLASIRARGVSAGQRRRSRREIWQNRSGFVRYFNPYRKMPTDRRVVLECKYSGEAPILGGITLGWTVNEPPGPKSVSLDGRSVAFRTKAMPWGAYVFADVDRVEPGGHHEIVADF